MNQEEPIQENIFGKDILVFSKIEKNSYEHLLSYMNFMKIFNEDNKILKY